MAGLIYGLCALTSVLCAVLLWRSYARTRSRLLLWSTLCFVLLGMSNVLLVLDELVLPPEIDLKLLRLAAAFIGVLLLVFGLAWEDD